MRLERKIRNTIMQELLELEDQWIEGEDATINLYDRFKYHGLTNTAISHVKPQVEGWLLDYEDAYYKRCEQAVEGYSHVKKSSLKHRIDVCKSMLEDMERIKSASKATRTIKISKPKAADKQVSKMQYKKEDNDFKIVSIHPIQIIGKRRLYTFNTKHRELNMFYTDDPKGFQVSGSTLKRFDKLNSVIPFLNYDLMDNQVNASRLLNTTFIPENFNEWYFICASFNPNIEEDISHDDENGLGDSTLEVTPNYWLNHINPNTGGAEANSGYGNKCKVEIISRSDLLRARGFKV